MTMIDDDYVDSDVGEWWCHDNDHDDDIWWFILYWLGGGLLAGIQRGYYMNICVFCIYNGVIYAYNCDTTGILRHNLNSTTVIATETEGMLLKMMI